MKELLEKRMISIGKYLYCYPISSEKHKYIICAGLMDAIIDIDIRNEILEIIIDKGESIDNQHVNTLLRYDMSGIR